MCGRSTLHFVTSLNVIRTYESVPHDGSGKGGVEEERQRAETLSSDGRHCPDDFTCPLQSWVASPG